MKLKSLLLTALFMCLCSCGDNPSPPAVEGISLNYGTVTAGTDMQVSVTYRIEANKSGGDYTGKPFSTLISIPVGATYLNGSSQIIFQSARTPDAQGLCADGRTYLAYNIQEGEIIDSNKSDDFLGVISFTVNLQAAANEQELIAQAWDTLPADPCAPFEGESTEFRVKS